MSHIVIDNPIVFDLKDTKKTYINRLKKYARLGGWNRRKYVASELEAYNKIIFSCDEVREEKVLDSYKYYILFDLIHLLGYELSNITLSKIDNVKKQYLIDFKGADLLIVNKIIDSAQRASNKFIELLNIDELSNEKNYIELIRKNIFFREQKPFRLMVTATMSAGKSTFINSLIGKYICLSQNMACTSKIHSIINKAFEDGYTYEYDKELVLTADKEELINDNEDNLTNMIYVATNFNGVLSNTRIIVNDSPGVNFSGDKEHQKIAGKLIKRRRYNVLIYVINVTQLGTNDEDEHLDFIKQTIGKTPIIFIMNKVDAVDPDEEDIESIISRQRKYLIRKGFRNPVICPISARAGYLAKKYNQIGLTRSEKRELYNYVDKFEMMNLSTYYSKVLPKIKIKDNTKEEIQLLKNCGVEYIEQLIYGYYKGEN